MESKFQLGAGREIFIDVIVIVIIYSDLSRREFFDVEHIRSRYSHAYISQLEVNFRALHVLAVYFRTSSRVFLCAKRHTRYTEADVNFVKCSRRFIFQLDALSSCDSRFSYKCPLLVSKVAVSTIRAFHVALFPPELQIPLRLANSVSRIYRIDMHCCCIKI